MGSNPTAPTTTEVDMPLQERVVKEWRVQDQHEINGFFIGNRIGSGLSREVFEYGLLPRRFVVKTEHGDDGNHFQNVIEYKTWNVVRGTEFEKFFAPVSGISFRGVVLVQARTYPAPKSGKLPEFVPDFITDARDCNWGWYKNRYVLHDYGLTMVSKDMLAKAGMVSRESRMKSS